MDSPEVHPPISTQSAEHTAESPVVHQESNPVVESLHREEKAPPQEAKPPLNTAEDEAKQRAFIESMKKAEATQAIQAENPSSREIPMEAPVTPPPEPESILNAPPQRKSFIVGMLTQIKDGIVHLFDGLKKLFFSKKSEKPPRPTSFKNIDRSGTSPVSFKGQDAPVSFKQQPAGA